MDILVSNTTLDSGLDKMHDGSILARYSLICKRCVEFMRFILRYPGLKISKKVI